MDNTNILYGKKWAVCGDSFTNGDFSGGYSETFEDGPSVPGTFSNLFSNGIYKTIDEDVDYITLYYGINISCGHYNAFVTGPSIPLNFF